MIKHQNKSKTGDQQNQMRIEKSRPCRALARKSTRHFNLQNFYLCEAPNTVNHIIRSRDTNLQLFHLFILQLHNSISANLQKLFSVQMQQEAAGTAMLLAIQATLKPSYRRLSGVHLLSSLRHSSNKQALLSSCPRHHWPTATEVSKLEKKVWLGEAHRFPTRCCTNCATQEVTDVWAY